MRKYLTAGQLWLVRHFSQCIVLIDSRLSTCCSATMASGGRLCCASSASRKVSGATARACGGGIAGFAYMVLLYYGIALVIGFCSDATSAAGRTDKYRMKFSTQRSAREWFQPATRAQRVL